jgi:hypothetical protein
MIHWGKAVVCEATAGKPSVRSAYRRKGELQGHAKSLCASLRQIALVGWINPQTIWPRKCAKLTRGFSDICVSPIGASRIDFAVDWMPPQTVLALPDLILPPFPLKSTGERVDGEGNIRFAI